MNPVSWEELMLKLLPGKKKTTPSENSNLLLAFLMLLIANISILPTMKIITQKYEDLFPRYWAESFMWMTLI